MNGPVLICGRSQAKPHAHMEVFYGCETNAVDKFVDRCSLACFASKKNAQRVQTEKHRSATSRHQISGTRQYAAANVRLMLKFMKSKGTTGTSINDFSMIAGSRPWNNSSKLSCNSLRNSWEKRACWHPQTFSYANKLVLEICSGCVIHSSPLRPSTRSTSRHQQLKAVHARLWQTRSHRRRRQLVLRLWDFLVF